MTGELESGTLFACELTCTAELPWGERLEVYGERGVVIVDQLSDPVVRHFRGELDVDPVALPGVSYDPRGWKATSIAAGSSTSCAPCATTDRPESIRRPATARFSWHGRHMHRWRRAERRWRCEGCGPVRAKDRKEVEHADRGRSVRARPQEPARTGGAVRTM